MKFGKRFENQKISEWVDFYVSYRMLKKLLSPFKIFSKQCHLGPVANDQTGLIHNLCEQDIEKLETFANSFEKILFTDLEKMFVFYNSKLNETVGKWKKLRINLMIYKQKDSSDSLTRDLKDKNFSLLKEAFQVLIKELKLLTDYVNINLEAFQKILKKQNKLVSKFFPEDDLKERFAKYLVETKAFSMRDRLNNFLYAIEDKYINTFYKNRDEGIDNLRKIFQGNLISRNEVFWFGLYLGFTTLLIAVVVILAWNGDLDLDENEYFKEIFPIFRGMAIILFYTWLLSWNVYGWSANCVNYKLIFHFNHHYSQLSQILKRAAAFSTILMVLLLWYLIIEGDNDKFARSLNWMPSYLIPLFVWLLFIGYLIFPHPRILNGQGRLYFWKMFLDILKSPFQPVTFKIIWATDQLASLVLPLKDLEYTVCFYFKAFFSDETGIHSCQSPDRITRGVIVALIPLMFRSIQCLRQVYDNKLHRRDPLVNLGKYMTSAVSSVLSYLVATNDRQLPYVLAWTFFAAFGTIYSYAWDLKKDWGLLEPKAKHKFLRNQLAYRNPILYYLAMIGNLVMRLAWVLSISPGIIAQILRPELFTLIIGFVEAFRRTMWNFFRVEKEHLSNVGKFVVVQEMKLPYNDLNLNENKVEEGLFAEELKVIMEDDNELRKPISSAGYIPYTNLIGQVLKKYGQSNQENSKMEIGGSEADDLVKFKNLSEVKINFESPLQEKQDLNGELQKYKKIYPQPSLLVKQIVSFKQNIFKKGTKIELAYTKKSEVDLVAPNGLDRAKESLFVQNVDSNAPSTSHKANMSQRKVIPINNFTRKMVIVSKGAEKKDAFKYPISPEIKDSTKIQASYNFSIEMSKPQEINEGQNNELRTKLQGKNKIGIAIGMEHDATVLQTTEVKA